jgi:hypothetical protein
MNDQETYAQKVYRERYAFKKKGPRNYSYKDVFFFEYEESGMIVLEASAGYVNKKTDQIESENLKVQAQSFEEAKLKMLKTIDHFYEVGPGELFMP